MRKEIIYIVYILSTLALSPIHGQLITNVPPLVLTVDELLNWTTTAADDRNIASVPLANRFIESSAQFNPSLHSDIKVLYAPDGMNNMGNYLEEQSQFNLYNFTHWQYIDLFLWFGGTASESVQIPSAPWVNAAHKNGVKVMGNVFFAPNVFGGSENKLLNFLEQDQSGNFVAADILIEMAQYYGFDGWCINQETNVTSIAATILQDFMKYLQQIKPANMEIIWYDAMLPSGQVSWQDRLNDNNKSFFQDGNEWVSDAMFTNYFWDCNFCSDATATSYTASSYFKALELGRSNFDVYTGADLWPGRSSQPAFNNVDWIDNIFDDANFTFPYTSIGLFAPHFMFEPSTGFSNFKNDPSDYQSFYNTELQLFAGDDLNFAMADDNGNWKGFANYIPAKSVINQTPFATNFNTGHGRIWSVEGQQTNRDWHDMSQQDILPTWLGAKEQIASNIVLNYDFTTAYKGGSSLKISGDLNSEIVSLPLYQTKLPVSISTQISITFKAQQPGITHLYAKIKTSSGQTNIYDIGNANGSDWQSVDLSLSDLSGQEIIWIGFELNTNGSSANNYIINIGEININNSASIVEICDNGIDDDGDGLIDCFDSDCSAEPNCMQEEICDNGIDDDGDGLIDCFDSDCSAEPNCIQDEICDNGIDDDGDGLIDCFDSDCSAEANCNLPEICDNGIDDDFDGLTDMADIDCSCNDTLTFTIPSFFLNPSLEARSCCPSSFTQLHCVDDWHQATNATSDYLNTCGWTGGTGGAGSYSAPPDGTGFLSTIGANDGGDGSAWFEYGGQCTNTLQANRQYIIRFWVAAAAGGSYGGNAIGDLTILGIPTCPTFPISTRFNLETTYDVVARIPVNLTGNGTWQQVSAVFTPTQSYNAVLFGPGANMGSQNVYIGWDNFELNELQFVEPQIAQTGDICADGSSDLFVTNPSDTLNPDFSYQWYRDGVAISGANGPSHTTIYQLGGTYMVQVQHDGKCDLSNEIILPTCNLPPDISVDCNNMTTIINHPEDVVNITTIYADDPDNDPLTFSIIGGNDASLFNLNNTTGLLEFINPPVFNNPVDANADNNYELIVKVEDGKGGEDTENITITIIETIHLYYDCKTPIDTCLSPYCSSFGQIESIVYNDNNATHIEAIFSNSSNCISVRPLGNWVGTDTVSFTICNSSNDCNIIPIIISANPIPDATITNLTLLSENCTTGFHEVELEIANVGTGVLPAGTSIPIYNGDPIQNGATIIGLTTTAQSIGVGLSIKDTIQISDITSPTDIYFVINSHPNNLIPLDTTAFLGTSITECNFSNNIAFIPICGSISLSIKVFLSGAFDPVTGLMLDSLRSKGYIPATEPFSELEVFDYIIGESKVITDPQSVFAITGPDAIVDWIFVELRDKNDPAVVLETQAGLLQRDGDVVEIDAISSLQFSALSGDYYIAVRHRNHLGAMTDASIRLGSVSTIVDFTDPLSANGIHTWGTLAQRDIEGTFALWPGNAKTDKRLKFEGGTNDKNAITASIVHAPGNTTYASNFIEKRYHYADVNLDGLVKFEGQNNDKNIIANTIILFPHNTTFASNYIITEQLP